MVGRTRLVCVPLAYIREDGDPRGEVWFSPLPLSAAQAESILKDVQCSGCFVLYKPTYKSDRTPYELSVRLPSGVVNHYPIYQLEEGNLGIKAERGVSVEQKSFKNLKDLVEYHKGNRGILDCRLKKAPKEVDRPITFGKDLEIESSEVEIEEKELGTGCFGSYHQVRVL